MYIKKIKLNNFRNYCEQEIELSNEINVFLDKMHKEKQILLNQFFCVH